MTVSTANVLLESAFGDASVLIKVVPPESEKEEAFLNNVVRCFPVPNIRRCRISF